MERKWLPGTGGEIGQLNHDDVVLVAYKHERGIQLSLLPCKFIKMMDAPFYKEIRT